MEDPGLFGRVKRHEAKMPKTSKRETGTGVSPVWFFR